MSRQRIFGLLVLLLVVGFQVGYSAPGSLLVKVVDNSTLAPLVGAEVRVSNTTGTFVRIVQNSSGVLFPKLSPGKYSVEALVPEYSAKKVNLTVYSGIQAKANFKLAKRTALPITKKYLLLVFDPVIKQGGGKKVTEHFSWNSPYSLTNEYVASTGNFSRGVVKYVEGARLEVDGFPRKENGYKFSGKDYLDCVSTSGQSSPNCGLMADYLGIITDYRICDYLNNGSIDELWMFGGPWFGFWEANQAGVGAFDTNGPVIAGTACNRRLNIMGFSYERALPEMLEDLGHRTEGTMRYYYRGWDSLSGRTAWDNFTRYDKITPRKAACGNVHYAPNSASDYDWANPSQVVSSCNDWYNYPYLTGTYKWTDCSEWGCSDLGYKVWWLAHLPHYQGTGPDGKSLNWWKYVLG